MRPDYDPSLNGVPIDDSELFPEFADQNAAEVKPDYPPDFVRSNVDDYSKPGEIIERLERENVALKAENARLAAALEAERKRANSFKQQESDQFNRYVKQINSTIIGYSDEFGYIMNNETIDYIILQTPLDGESHWTARHPAIQEAINGGWVEVIYTVQYVNDQGKGYTVRLTESGKQRRNNWFAAAWQALKKE